MDLIEKIKQLFNERKVDEIYEFLFSTLQSNPIDIDLNITAIYVLHLSLVEYFYTEEYEKKASELLIEVFNRSRIIFAENTEYLFFIGKILYIADWYFDLEDSLKPLQEKLAFKMQKQAYFKEPTNKLYAWAYYFSLSDPKAVFLAKALVEEKSLMAWLESKGVQGEYIREALYQLVSPNL